MLTETTSSFPARTQGRSPEGERLRSSRRTYADMRALDRALVLADLPAARAAFLRLQEDLPLIAEAVSTDPFPVEARPHHPLRMLARCLMSDDLSGAREAFDTFARPGSAESTA